MVDADRLWLFRYQNQQDSRCGIFDGVMGLCHLLLIEDNPADSTLLGIEIREAGAPIKVTSVNTGEQALQALSAAAFDLIVLDLNLPGMDGFEFLAQIKRDPRLASIPVVVLSVSQDPRDQRRALQSGALVYFEKSLDLDGSKRIAQIIVRLCIEPGRAAAFGS